MRWLLLKDLQILRRSPLLVVALVAYPVVISILIGFALSKGPDKPKVAFLNEVPAGQSTLKLGGERVDAARYANELFKNVEPIRVKTRREAIDRVKSGEALAALIVPANIVQRLQGSLSLAGGGPPPQVEVVYNVEDPIKARYVESTIKARLADANQALSTKLTQTAATYLRILLRGGSFSLLGRQFQVLGLTNTKTILDATLAQLPKGSPDRQALERVSRFAGVAIDNLDLSGPILRSVSSPVHVKRTVLSGGRTPLDAFAVAVSVTISLMFVTVLLAAGMLALEREEHVFTRLVRGLVPRLGLVVEKIGLAAICAFAVTLVMLMGLGAFVHLDWSRFGLWVVALGAGALGFGALGVAIGSVAREVRAASLLAFLLSLPVAFLALVPSGSVAGGLYDIIRVVSALFPFRPALTAVNGALNAGESGFGAALGHLAILVVAYAAIARVALRRFA